MPEIGYDWKTLTRVEMVRKPEKRCIICLQTDGGFHNKAHVIPESACNEDLLLPNGFECDRCNSEFSPIEQQVIRTFPGQFFRVGLVEKTKRGKKPTADIKGGKIKRIDSDDRPTIQITLHSKSPFTVYPNIEPDSSQSKWEQQKLSSKRVSAFLAKISLGYFCLQGGEIYSTEFDNLRDCVKSVGASPFIPFFIGVSVEATQVVQLLSDNRRFLEASKPLWIRFPGFSAVIPTSKTLPNSALESLRSFVVQELPGQFLLISDPNWEKLIRVDLTLTPSSNIAKEGQHELWQDFRNEEN